MARVIWLVFSTERMRRRMSLREAIGLLLARLEPGLERGDGRVEPGCGFRRKLAAPGDRQGDFRMLRGAVLEELALETIEVRHRNVVQMPLAAGIDDHDLLL